MQADLWSAFDILYRQEFSAEEASQLNPRKQVVLQMLSSFDSTDRSHSGGDQDSTRKLCAGGSQILAAMHAFACHPTR
jgi:hypothetical protein